VPAQSPPNKPKLKFSGIVEMKGDSGLASASGSMLRNLREVSGRSKLSFEEWLALDSSTSTPGRFSWIYQFSCVRYRWCCEVTVPCSKTSELLNRR